jgi:hypothetical protein
MNKQLILEKYIKVAVKKAIQEAEEQQKRTEKAIYLVYRFPGLKKIIEDAMSPSFGRYINDITVVSPKPTTFNVDLINGESFNIIYIGRSNFRLKIAGRKYDPANIGELERASQAITDLLSLNYAPAESKAEDKQHHDKELAADLSAANNEPPFPSPTPNTQPPTPKPEEEQPEPKKEPEEEQPK